MSETPAPTTDEPVLVGFPRRFGALIYDSLLAVAVAILASAIAVAASHNTLSEHRLAFQVYLFLVLGWFFSWFWTHGGQTLGMRAWKIRVERLDGAPVTWGQALLRFALAWATLGIGLLWSLADRDRQALYDRITKTRVIRVWSASYVPHMR